MGNKTLEIHPRSIWGSPGRYRHRSVDYVPDHYKWKDVKISSTMDILGAKVEIKATVKDKLSLLRTSLLNDLVEKGFESKNSWNNLPTIEIMILGENHFIWRFKDPSVILIQKIRGEKSSYKFDISDIYKECRAKGDLEDYLKFKKFEKLTNSIISFKHKELLADISILKVNKRSILNFLNAEGER